jgi:hypothetical protein
MMNLRERRLSSWSNATCAMPLLRGIVIPPGSRATRVAGLTPVAGDFAFPASLASPASQVDAIVSTASIGAQAALLSMCGVSIVEQRQETDNGTKAGNAS